MNALLMLILLAFEPPDASGIPILIIHHRFDRAYSDTLKDTCVFINRSDPCRTWVVYKDCETPFDNQNYTILKARK